MSSNEKVILITGASSGVGQSTARFLSQRGYKIFGTSRNPASAEAIPDVEMVPLDVRSDDSVAACLKAVADEAGRIDVLVNNAAYELAGAIEEISIDEAKAQFETNFFGVVRMVQELCHRCVNISRGKLSTSALYPAYHLFHSWTSTLPANSRWKATRKPYAWKSHR